MKKKFEIEYEQDDAIANMIYTALAARYNIETKVTELPVAEEKEKISTAEVDKCKCKFPVDSNICVGCGRVIDTPPQPEKEALPEEFYVTKDLEPICGSYARIAINAIIRYLKQQQNWSSTKK